MENTGFFEYNSRVASCLRSKRSQVRILPGVPIPPTEFPQVIDSCSGLVVGHQRRAFALTQNPGVSDHQLTRGRAVGL